MRMVGLRQLICIFWVTLAVARPAHAVIDEYLDGAEAGATYLPLAGSGTTVWRYETAATKYDVGSRSFTAGDSTMGGNICEILETPILRLKPAGTSEFSFRALLNLESAGPANNYDWLVVQIATEAGGFTNWSTAPFAGWHTQTMSGPPGCDASVYSGLVIGGTTRDNNTDFATQGETFGPANLDSYLGQRIKIRILFSQDNIVASQAWLDEIKVTNVDSSIRITSLASQTTVGSPESFTVTAINGDFSTLTSYTGEVQFSSTDGSAGLPANYTFLPGDNGTRSFSVTFNTGGYQSVTATDTGTPAITAQATSLVIDPGTTILDGAEAGATQMSLGTGAEAWGYDTSGTKVHTGSRSFVAGDGIDLNPQCKIMETSIIKLSSSGAGSFSFRALMDLAYSGGNMGWLAVQISTENGSYNDWTTGPFAGWHGSTNWGWQGCSSLITGGVIGGPTRDGNTDFATQGEYFGPVSLSSYAGQKIKVRFLMSYDNNFPSQAWIDQVQVTNAVPYFTITGLPASLTTGASTPFTVTAHTKEGAVDTSYTQTITFSSTDGSASIPSNYTFVGGDLGSRAFSAIFNTPGTQSITADQLSDTTIDGSRSTFVADGSTSTIDGAESGATQANIGSGSSAWTYNTAAQKTDNGSRSFQAGDGVTSAAQCRILETPVLKIKAAGSSDFLFRALLDLHRSGAGGNYGWLGVQIATESGGYINWSNAPFAAWHSATPWSWQGCHSLWGFGNVIGGANRDGNSDFSTQGETFGPVSLNAYLGQKIKIRFLMSHDDTYTSQAWIDGITVTNVESYLSLTGLPTNSPLATPVSMTVSAFTKDGAVDTGYTQTVAFTSSDGAANLPADYTYLPGDLGSKSFLPEFNTLGAQSITATQTGAPTMTAAMTTNVFDPTISAMDGAEIGATQMVIGTGATGWDYDTTGSHVYTGARSFVASTGVSNSGECRIMETAVYKLKSTGTPYFSFKALLDLMSNGSTNYGGLVVQISTEAGRYTDWTTAPFTAWHNAYNSAWSGCPSSVYTGNLIGGSARNGNSDFSTQGETFGPLSLAAYGGQKVKFRFIFTQDSWSPSQAWIDDVMITNVEPYLLLSGIPPASTIGTSTPFTVSARQLDGSPDASYVGTVTFTSSDGAAGLPGNYTYTGGDAGTHAFNATFNTTGEHSVTATDTITPSLTGYTETIVSAADTFADDFEMGATYVTTGGNPWVYDTTAAGRYNGARSMRAGDGVAAWSACRIMETPVLKLKSAGPSELSFRALFDLQQAAGLNYDWVAVQISTEASNYTSWSPAPFAAWHTSTMTGTPGCSSFYHTGSVIGGPTRDGNTDFATQGELMSPVSLAAYAGQKIKIRIMLSHDTAGTASQVWIDELRLTNVEPYYAMTASFPLSGLSGILRPFTLTAYTLNGQVNTTYTGTAEFTSTDGAASLPADYTFVPGDLGTRPFNVTFNTAGTQSITATDSVLPNMTISRSTNVLDAGSTLFDNAEVGQTVVSLGPAPAWTYDSLSTKVYDGSRSLRAGGGASTALCSILETPVVKIKSTGTSEFSFRALYDLQWSGTQNFDWFAVQIATEAGGFTDWTNAPFAAWHANTMTVAPGCSAAIYTGNVIGGAARDSNTTFSTQGELMGPASLAAYAGQKVKIRFLYSQNASVLSRINVDDIIWTNLEPSYSITGLPFSVFAGAPTTYTVSVRGPSGSIDPTYTGTVQFSSSDGAASLPGNYTFVPGDGGAHTFAATFNTTGSQTLTATDTVTATLTTNGTTLVDPTDIFHDDAEIGSTSMDLSISSPAWAYNTTAAQVDLGSRSFQGGNGTTTTGMCEIMETPVIALKAAGTGEFSFRGLFDLEDMNAGTNYDWIAVQIATEAGGFTDWATTPFTGLHTQAIGGTPGCSGAVYSGLVVGGTTRDDETTFSTQGELLGPYSLASYAGQRVKFRFIFSQDTVAVASRVWIDQIKVTNIDPGTPTNLQVVGPTSTTSNACSGLFSVIARDSGNRPITVGSDIPLIISGGGKKRIYSDSSCSTEAIGIKINKGHSKQTFHYKSGTTSPAQICRTGRTSTGVLNTLRDGLSLRICGETDSF